MQSVILFPISLLIIVQRNLECAKKKPLNNVVNTLFTFTHLDYWYQMSSGIATVNRINGLIHHIEDFSVVEIGLHDFVIFEMLPSF